MSCNNQIWILKTVFLFIRLATQASNGERMESDWKRTEDIANGKQICSCYVCKHSLKSDRYERTSIENNEKVTWVIKFFKRKTYISIPKVSSMVVDNPRRFDVLLFQSFFITFWSSVAFGGAERERIWRGMDSISILWVQCSDSFASHIFLSIMHLY